MERKKILTITALLHASIAQISGYAAHYAVINTPVADLVGEPFKHDVIKHYRALPVYAEGSCCPRIHQALFNEVVKIVDETECEYCIEIANAYFVTKKDKTPFTRYWTLKENCTVLNDTIKKSVPTPLSFKKKMPASKPTIVLTQPWHEARTGSRFSIGTRFIYCPRESDDETLTLMLYDHVKKREISSGIHHSACRIEKNNLSAPEARAEMIALIRSWIGNHCTFVPYIWGGCSFVERYAGNFRRKYDKKTECWIYIYPKTKRILQTGLDCAGLILRAAQAVGIPFYCKNSYTAAAQLKSITTYQEIEVGDILWIEGHVMLIADLNRNTIIEARGYTHGYGKLQEIPISEEFEGIETIQQLVEAMHAKKALKRLEKKGTVIATIPHYKLLKLY